MEEYYNCKIRLLSKLKINVNISQNIMLMKLRYVFETKNYKS